MAFGDPPLAPIDETWRWMPLDERDAERPTYLDVLFDRPEPGAPLTVQLEGWIKEQRPLADRANLILGRHAVDTALAHPTLRDPADMLLVADVLIRIHDETILDTTHRPQRNQGNSGSVQALTKLQRILDDGRSLWTITRLPNGTWGLGRRVDAASQHRAEVVLSPETLAAQHLRRAWGYLYQRESAPGHALDEAIAALESAGRRVVIPTNRDATLGLMISALRDKPEKWTVAAGTVEAFRERLAMLWTRQPRHGVVETNDVKDVSPQLAEAAVHEAITLVHWFTSGLIALKPDQP